MLEEGGLCQHMVLVQWGTLRLKNNPNLSLSEKNIQKLIPCGLKYKNCKMKQEESIVNENYGVRWK